METFVKRLRECRIKHGYTQKEMAKMLQISEQTYCRYENNKRKPRLGTLIKISNIMKVTVNYLLGMEN